jgi:hypothetical protein
LEAHALATDMEMRWDQWQILAALAEIEEQLGNEDESESWREHAGETIKYVADHIDSEDLCLSFLSLPEVQSVMAV